MVLFHAGEARALARARYTTQSLSSYGRAVPAGRVVVHAADVYPETGKADALGVIHRVA